MSAEVRLRAVVPSDLPIFFENQRDPAAAAMAEFPSRDQAAFTTHWERILADERNIVWTVLADGNVAGNVCCFELDGHQLVGYWLGREYWGKGIATRALAELLRRVPIRPLRAHVAKSNIASIRVLQKCGFAVCGEEKGNGRSGAEVEEIIMQLDATQSASPATRHHTHEELFATTPECLFALLHTPSAIRAWWGAARAIVIPKEGGIWCATWGADEDAPDYITAATLRVFDPPRRLVLADYRYVAKTGPLPFHADFVTEFTVAAHAEGATLRVVQDGFPCDSAADDFYAACERGWKDTFAGIRKYLGK